MSGPKCVELSLSQREAERREYANRCAILASEYTRIEQQFQELSARLAEVGLSCPSIPQTGEHARQIAVMLKQDRNREAAETYSRENNKAKALFEEAQARLQARIADVRSRFRKLAADQEAVVVEREGLVAYARSAAPNAWPDAERKKIEEILAQVLQDALTPDFIEPALNVAAITRLEQGERALIQTGRVLQEGRQRIEDALNETHARLLTASLLTDLKPPQTLADFLRNMTKTSETPLPDDPTQARLDQLLSGVAALEAAANWNDLLRKAETIRAERDPNRRRVLYEGLLFECDTRLGQLRKVARWQAEVDALIDSVAHLKGTAVDAVVAELHDMRRAARIVELAAVKARLHEVMATEQKRLERERKRAAVLESLQELGYETSEGMETALVQAGKVVIHKPGDAEYAVEVVANDDLSLLQTTMMRFADSDQMTDQQRLRDTEREEAWCEDHAKLRRKMAERGLQTNFKLKMAAGEHPVKVVVDQDRNQRRKATAIAPQTSRTQTA